MAEPNGRLTAALEYYERFGHIFPLRSKSEQYLPSWKPDQEYPLDKSRVVEWWTQWPEAWLGLPLGSSTNTVRLDADGEVPQDLVRGIPITPEFTTPSGGRGWLLKYTSELPVGRLVLWKGNSEHQELRYQSNGCYTVLPPSPGYVWVDGRSPADVSTAELPRSISDSILSAATAKELANWDLQQCPLTAAPDRGLLMEALPYIPADDREVWLKVGFALHAAGDEYFDWWIKWSQTCPEKFDEDECVRFWKGMDRNRGITPRYIVNTAVRLGWVPSKPLYEPISDTGNANILAKLGDGKIKHSSAWGWLAWDGRRWVRDSGDATKIVQELQKEVVQLRINRAVKSLAKLLAHGDPAAADFKDRKKKKLRTIALIRKYEEEHHYRGARVLASSDLRLSCRWEDFDKHPFLLNCPNGTIDLSTGKFLAHDPEHRLTQMCPTEYRPAAECPRWIKFLSEVFDGEKELIMWSQKLSGYCLTGDTSLHILPVLYGTGRNGKTTWVDVHIGVLGPDYSCTTPQGFLAAKKQESHPTEIADLYGKRFVFDMETGEGTKLNEERVKRLTGGDLLKGRRMKEDFWEFAPTHKLLLGTNHDPSVRGQDVAIWGRIKKVPFNVSFYNREEYGLKERLLREEAEGILAWMVQGCLRWQQEGLGEPKAVSDATEAYRADQDQVARFLADCFEREAEAKVNRREVSRLYDEWCRENRVWALESKTFVKRMTANGHPRDASNNHYLGLVVKKRT